MQAEPALKVSEGRPAWGAIVVTTLAVLAVVGTVFYAVTRESTEAARTAKTISSPPSSAAPSSMPEAKRD